jgi:AcrR family transcriptional regulator
MKRQLSHRRDQLLDASIEYILKNGVADLSLRPLAAAVGSKARLLIYHFGTRDALVAEAMLVVRDRVQKAFAALIHHGDGRTPSQIIRAFWFWATARKHRRYLRLFFEVHGLGLQKPDPYDRYLKGAVSSWVEMMTSVLPAEIPSPRRHALATLAVSGTVGVLLDLLSSRNEQNSALSFDLFVESFELLLKNEISQKESWRREKPRK